MDLGIDLKPGKYVVAVSGGIDSMVLLHALSRLDGLELIVAHFNHGIREASNNDEKFVERSAKKLGLSFEVGHGNLGKKASESTARDARYTFLKQVQIKYRAKAIVTGHHQDDLIETAVINVLRGTGRKGITSISSNKLVLRPLLNTRKSDIIQYAKKNHVGWRQDESNQDEKYLRNLIRKKLKGSLTLENRGELISNYDKVAETNTKLDKIIATISRNIINNDELNRIKYVSLPHDVGKEVLMWWLDSLGIGPIDRKLIERLDMTIRTAKDLSKHPIIKGNWLIVETDRIKFTTSN